MSRLAHVLGIVGLVAVLGFASPAHAVENVVAVSGTGTINPGLPCPSTGCTIHLDFTAVFAGEDASGTATCTLDGVDNYPGGGMFVFGRGYGTINCSGGVTANGRVDFERLLVDVDVYGTITVNGRPATVEVTLAFHWTTTPPVTSFGVNGGGMVSIAS